MLRSVSLFSLLFSVAIFHPVVGAQEANDGHFFVENSTINGVTGLGFWPNLEKVPLSVEDLERCEVHLVPTYDPSIEVVEPCQTWFLPPRLDEKYLFWMEAGNHISKQEMLFSSSVRTDEVGLGKPVTVVLYPAGRVVLGESRSFLRPGESVRLLVGPQGFARRVTDSSDHGREGVVLPVGTAIAAVNNDRVGNNAYEKITRPFEVTAGKSVAFSPRSPGSDESILILRVDGRLGPDETVSMAIVLDGQPKPPDFLTRTRSWAIGVWYDLEPGQVGTKIKATSAYAEPRTIRLRKGKIEYESIQLIRLPEVEVHFDLPTTLEGETSLLIEDLGDEGRLVEEIPLKERLGDTVVQRLPLSLVRLTIVAGEWSFTKVVDLTDGNDEYVVFQPRSIEVTGDVTLDDDPVRAVVGFYADRVGEWFDVETDDEGHYRTVVFEEIGLTRYRQFGAGDSEWVLAPVRGAISRDTEYDIEIPNNRWKVVVTDEESKEPIHDASVIFSNKGDEGDSRAARITTDEDGLALLPPMRFPNLRLRVEAEEYHSTQREYTISDEMPPDKTIEIEIVPTDPVYAFHVIFSDNRPAAGANVYLLAALDAAPLWIGQCDSAGSVEAPDFPAVWYAARHANVSFVIEPLNPDMKDWDEIPVQLPDAAAPVRIRAVDPSGAGVAQARFRVWVDGVPLDYSTRLLLMPDSSLVSDSSGLIHLSGLPGGNFDILAWYPNPDVRLQAQLGEYDFRKTTVGYPWPSLIDVEVVE